jgi:hypothetical protein
MIWLIILALFAGWRWQVWKHRTHALSQVFLDVKNAVEDLNAVIEDMKK